MPSPQKQSQGEITMAWWAWNAFCAGAVAVLAVAVVDCAWDPHPAGAAAWLLLPGLLWAFLLVPAVLVLKSGVLVAPWQRKAAEATGYRKGLLLIWAVLEVGVVLCCVAAMVAGTLLPGGLVAGLLTMGLFALRPSAAALAAD